MVFCVQMAQVIAVNVMAEGRMANISLGPD